MKSIKRILHKKIKFSLVFFLLLIFSCSRHKTIDVPEIIYKGEEAVGLKFYSNIEPTELQITLAGENNPPILGKMLWKTDHFEFVPLIPFTSGLKYQLKSKDEVISKFTIPRIESKEKLELLSWLPSQDTIPENLLKMYLEFSSPMNNIGNPLDYITVRDATSGEQVAIFLSLENPLWNENHTLLTLWLDPGRIKTDLIPNKEMGMPLEEGHYYEITVSDKWTSASGARLNKSYKREFLVTLKDLKKPNISSIYLSDPKENTMDNLNIYFKDNWDQIVFIENAKITRENGDIFNGTFQISESLEGIQFSPNSNWSKGLYYLKLEGRAEDLAGNNLQRLFDEDISNEKSNSTTEEDFSISFEVK